MRPQKNLNRDWGRIWGHIGGALISLFLLPFLGQKLSVPLKPSTNPKNRRGDVWACRTSACSYNSTGESWEYWGRRAYWGRTPGKRLILLAFFRKIGAPNGAPKADFRSIGGALIHRKRAFLMHNRQFWRKNRHAEMPQVRKSVVQDRESPIQPKNWRESGSSPPATPIAPPIGTPSPRPASTKRAPKRAPDTCAAGSGRRAATPAHGQPGMRPCLHLE